MSKVFNFFKLYFDRSFANGMIAQIIWLTVIMSIVYLGLVGLSYFYSLYTPITGEDYRGVWSETFLLLMDPGNYTGSMSSPFAIIGGTLGLIVFSGMLISVISNLLERRVDSFTKGETSYNVNNHVVILGINKTSPSLLRLIHQQHPHSFILVMCEQESEYVRRWLHQNINTKLEKQLIILHGIRYSDEDLLRLKLNRQVKEIYVLGEENETAHDANNMECLKKMAMMLPEGSNVKCHVLLNSPTMLQVLQTVDIDEDIRNRLSFHPFNFSDIWVQKVLATIPTPSVSINGEKQPWVYRPLDDTGIMAQSRKRVHLVIFGMNQMGETLAIHAARILHFPNFKEGDADTCSLITFIDSEADMRRKAFMNHYRHLFSLSRWRVFDAEACSKAGSEWNDPMISTSASPYKVLLGDCNFIDTEWEFIKGNMFDNGIKSYLEQCAGNHNEILTIALCHNESEYNLECCMAMTESILNKAHQILVRQKESPFTVNMLMRRPGYENLRPFGIESECYYGDIIHERYGKLVNACYSGIALHDEEAINEAWNNLSTALKWSNIYCANMLYSKLRFIGLNTEDNLKREDIESAISEHEEDIQRVEHNRWNMEKLLMGYRPLKDEEERRLWLSNKSIRNKMKASMMHLDLLSNDMLRLLDPESVQYDIMVNNMLADLYVIAQHDIQVL